MGSPRGAVGARPPSHAAYFVALAGILVLLLLLCCYFVYFCVKRVKELSRQTDPASVLMSAAPTARSPAPPPTSTYPVQPGVRDTATAMARLCKQLPATAGGGGTVFPAASSPAAQRTDVGAAGEPAPPPPTGPEVPPPTDKTPAAIAPPIMTHEVNLEPTVNKYTIY